MKLGTGIHLRRSIRLQNYDYSQAGAYFVTICTQNRECLFGKIVEEKTQPSAAGRMIQAVWNEIPSHYSGIDVAEFIVMPNHIHGIIIVGAAPRACPAPGAIPRLGQPRGVAPTEGMQGADVANVGAGPRACPESGQSGVGQPQGGAVGQPQGIAPTGYKRLSLPDVVHRFKTMTTKRYADGVKQSDWHPFQGRLWQRNYLEHIIRNEKDYLRICEYIQNNPAKWEQDRLNPAAYPENIGETHHIVGAGPCACPEKEGE